MPLNTTQTNKPVFKVFLEYTCVGGILISKSIPVWGTVFKEYTCVNGILMSLPDGILIPSVGGIPVWGTVF